MFPMLSGLAELRTVREVLSDVMEELRREGLSFDERIPVGIMIEMPSAAMVADHLAREVDFFSIGTNDLIQYTLAVDRVNEHVAYLYDPMHPGLLRLIDAIIRADHGTRIDLSICGEMAGDPEVAPLLVGMGLRTLSMNAVAIPQVKRVIQQCSSKALEDLARRALEMPTGADVRQAVRDYLREVVGGRGEPAR
jgi:phosphotransferase system enzyme I (PtsI)